jgi:hypothetical protein
MYFFKWKIIYTLRIVPKTYYIIVSIALNPDLLHFTLKAFNLKKNKNSRLFFVRLFHFVKKLISSLFLFIFFFFADLFLK